MMKIYIKNNFGNGFIWPLKSPIGVFISFVRKLDDSLYLYVDY